jgi:CBS domain-containing protein
MTRTVRQVMANELAVATEDMDAFAAAGIMLQHDVGALPVVNGVGSLLGIVTDRDLVTRVLGARTDPTDVRMGEIATSRSLVTVEPDTSLSDAVAMMAMHKVKRLPVVHDDELVGMVSMGDLANTASSKEAVGAAVAEVLESPATTTVVPELDRT